MNKILTIALITAFGGAVASIASGRPIFTEYFFNADKIGSTAVNQIDQHANFSTTMFRSPNSGVNAVWTAYSYGGNTTGVVEVTGGEYSEANYDPPLSTTAGYVPGDNWVDLAGAPGPGGITTDLGTRIVYGDYYVVSFDFLSNNDSNHLGVPPGDKISVALGVPAAASASFGTFVTNGRLDKWVHESITIQATGTNLSFYTGAKNGKTAGITNIQVEIASRSLPSAGTVSGTKAGS